MTTQDHAPEFNPREPIFQALTAQDVLDEALAGIMDQALEEDPQAEYPDDDIDHIAPSLRGAIMREIRERKLTPCRHAFSEMDGLAWDIVQALPEEERRAILDAMMEQGKGEPGQ